MTPTVDTGEREGYASALAGLWNDLSRTLARLDSLAGDPDGALADHEARHALPALQYALHAAGELAVGLDPPPGAATMHAELAAALADARDATAEVAEALAAGGPAAVEPLVPEWRGALFRVRLARMRLHVRPGSPAVPLPAAPVRAPQGGALAASLLVLAGAAAFAAGAALALWPLWTLGLALVAAGFFAYRP